MPGTQHIRLRIKILGLFFLIINCISIAAAVIENNFENYQQEVSLQLTQVPGTVESEDINRISEACIHHPNRFSFKKRHTNLYFIENNNSTDCIRPALNNRIYIAKTSILPSPAYYLHLSLYQLF